MSTEKENKELNLISFWHTQFRNAMIHKSPYTKKWLMYLDAYNGDYFKNNKLPEYKSNMVSNYIFSIVETIRPLMLDNNPKFQAMPRLPEGAMFSDDLQEALMYEWDREGMTRKLYKDLITTLVLGTSVYYIPWDKHDKNLKSISVNPLNLFPDPLATCVDDAEYLIYASYKNVYSLKNMFPEKADKLHGGDIKYSELVQNNDKNAFIDNQVLVLEIWSRGSTSFEGEEYGGENYKNGRHLILCPEIGILLKNSPNPYKDGELPFELIKDYDVPGKFWGEGEVGQLLSPQTHINQLNNAIIDSARATANMPWIIDKNSGIGVGSLTARPGLIVRKNPGTEVRREQPPQMPMYVTNAIDVYKRDLEQISGIFNTLKGESTTGVYTAQGLLALQEAGQVRIRLKVKLLEDSLGRIGQKFFSRMKQFWKEDRWLRITKADGSYDLKKFNSESLKYDYDIKIVGGSTMPVNRSAMLDLMIRLAQTPMPDGQNLVDRESVVYYLPEEIKAPLLKRMRENNVQLQELQQAVQELAVQLQQIAQQSEGADDEQLGVIEDIASTIERLNQQILQLKEEHDKMVMEQKEEEKLNKIKEDFYNKGYIDAEKLYSSEDIIGDGLEGENELPDEILEGLENMSDDELALLLEQNPELIDLIN